MKPIITCLVPADRLSRSLRDVLMIMERIGEAGAVKSGGSTLF